MPKAAAVLAPPQPWQRLAAKKNGMVWYGGFTSVQAHQRSSKAAILLVRRADDTEVKGGCFAKARLVCETATTTPHTADSSITRGRKVCLWLIDVSVVRYFCKG